MSHSPATLAALVLAERRAWRALSNDPAPRADKNAPHTPALLAAWQAAADAECVYRTKHEIFLPAGGVRS